MFATPYVPGLLNPRIEPGLPLEVRAFAEWQNAPWLGPDTLGIEVTVPALAARCGLGNIDPQHGDGDGRQAAIDVCLDLPLPPEGAALVTVRPDADALGAMAVLGLRVSGVALSRDLRDRVRTISEADRFARGPWPGPRPLPRVAADFDEAGFIGAIAALAADRHTALQQRVAGIAGWLTTGIEPAAYAPDIARRAGERLDRLSRGLDTVEPVAGGAIALARGSAGALRLGYRLAPVVVAEDLAFGHPPHRKLTIAQYAARYVDLRAVAAELTAHEPGWGGSAAIVGSPQGRDCSLALPLILECVVRHLC